MAIIFTGWIADFYMGRWKGRIAQLCRHIAGRSECKNKIKHMQHRRFQATVLHMLRNRGTGAVSPLLAEKGDACGARGLRCVPMTVPMGMTGGFSSPRFCVTKRTKGRGLRTAARVAHKARLGLVNAALLFYQLEQGNICPGHAARLAQHAQPSVRDAHHRLYPKQAARKGPRHRREAAALVQVFQGVDNG